MIVDAAYVAEALKRSVIVWDVRPADAYAKGHIHGAVSIGDAPKVLRDDNTEDFIETARIEKILGDGGIDPAREIIVYGNRGTWNPYFGLYAIQYFGGNAVRVYHGGIEDWMAAGHPVSREAHKLPAVALRLTANPAVAVSTREVVARLNDPNVQILDVRTPKEFSGEDIRAIRGGHIKGADQHSLRTQLGGPGHAAQAVAQAGGGQLGHVAQARVRTETALCPARS